VTEPDMTICKIDIVGKEAHNTWRIIGIVPLTVAASGAVHVYRGRKSVVLDSASDRPIVSGRSLADVLQKLANRAQTPVLLTDEVSGGKTTYRPE
jgi:hypothetical protein